MNDPAHVEARRILVCVAHHAADIGARSELVAVLQTFAPDAFDLLPPREIEAIVAMFGPPDDEPADERPAAIAS